MILTEVCFHNRIHWWYVCLICMIFFSSSLIFIPSSFLVFALFSFFWFLHFVLFFPHFLILSDLDQRRFLSILSVSAIFPPRWIYWSCSFSSQFSFSSTSFYFLLSLKWEKKIQSKFIWSKIKIVFMFLSINAIQ